MNNDLEVSLVQCLVQFLKHWLICDIIYLMNSPFPATIIRLWISFSLQMKIQYSFISPPHFESCTIISLSRASISLSNVPNQTNKDLFILYTSIYFLGSKKVYIHMHPTRPTKTTEVTQTTCHDSIHHKQQPTKSA